MLRDENRVPKKRTQYFERDVKAKTKHIIAVMNGAFCVLRKSEIPSANRPAMMATTEFRVVIIPNMSFREPPASSRCWRWYSVTIQLSNTLYIRVVERPPSMRPRKRMRMLSDRIVRQETE